MVLLGFHFRKVTQALVGRMVWEERWLDAVVGCIVWALHNSMGGIVPSVVTLAPGKGGHHLTAGIPVRQLSRQVSDRCWACTPVATDTEEGT